MQIDETVKKETLRIAAGTGVLSAFMLAVFLLLKRFDITVLLGSVWGSSIAVLNFFLLGLSVQKVSRRMNGVRIPKDQDDSGSSKEDAQQSDTNSVDIPEIRESKKQMQRSYIARLLLVAVAAIIAVKLPCFDSLAGILPLLFPRIVIAIISLKAKG